MKIVFISNFHSHHQQPLSKALAERCDYTFIETAQMSRDHQALGYAGGREPDYVCRYDRDPRRAEELLNQADVVIAGSAPEELVQKAIRAGKPVLRYSERPLKKGPQWSKYLPRLLKWHIQNPPGKRIYMLCASAFTAGDYAKFGLFRGRCLRWGYFPETRTYESLDALLEGKKKGSILWVGRCIHWKHPDDAIRVAARLKAEGLDFTLDLIGTGELEAQLRDQIDREGLSDRVRLLGGKNPDQVRDHMERAQIFLFTSDRQEGWGAVLNEAMNSGCAVVASHAAGATGYLVRDGENGCVYRSGDVDELYEKTKKLLTDPPLGRKLGGGAYETITGTWNADTAAERLVRLAREILAGEPEFCWQEGPGSRAKIMGEDWNRT